MDASITHRTLSLHSFERYILRCLAAESDLEFERERAAVNKRQFDDVLSAMHELGRANQTLQVHYEIIININFPR